MGRYRKIDPRIWNDAKFRELSDDGKFVFLFLLTHPHLTCLGAMRATVPGLAAELGWSVRRFQEGLAEGMQEGIVEYDPKASFLALPHFLRYNPPESPNVVIAWTAVWDLLPECRAKVVLYHRLKAFLQGYRESFKQAFAIPQPKSMANQEQEQEQEQEQNSPPVCSDEQTSPPGGELPARAAPAPPPGFARFWDVYPRKVGKDAALRVWRQRQLEPLTAQILAAVADQRASPQWRRDGGQYIPHPRTWLHQGRWQDESITGETHRVGEAERQRRAERARHLGRLAGLVPRGAGDDPDGAPPVAGDG